MVNIIHFDEVTSTNDVALDYAKKGAAHLTCVASLKQTKGRGRRGKSWRTLPYKSVAATFILRECVDHTLPLVASLAVYQTIKLYTPCQVKWPNDILVNGQKICGILAERFPNAGDSFYLLGVGINVKSLKGESMENISSTSIEDECGIEVSIEEVLQNLCENIELYIQKSTVDMMLEYKSICDTLGKEVIWKDDVETLVGIAVDITPYGSLMLNVNGQVREILSGEIVAQGAKEI